ncbi:Protein of unknown function [Sanguibacter gelidistatuariae]|uniref:DUF2510 domain-containing protein n=1 Tax=Sanguibacter gelidistatuariae TaxID=1814289 RepID=A0A1G6GST7_9MICO|nr:DUF2510 domain-containing protein [Sanguibacter gelidistatuariae]SDB85057.1 Protein of unknown function [Sanguibacter gelidistatuariae]
MAAPAGWYVDPQNPQLMRFFDGQSWTTQTQAAPAQAPQQGPTTQQGWQGQAQNQQGQNGAGVSYQHPGRQSADQQQSGYTQPGQQSGQPGFGQPGFQPSGYGQQPGVGQPATQQPANNHQPANQQAGAGGFQFGGGQQIPTADRPTTGSPRGVKIAIAGAAVGVVAIMGIGMAMSDDPTAGSASSTGVKIQEPLPSGYDCDTLNDDTISASAGNSSDQQLVATSGLTVVKDRIDDAKVPEQGKSMEVFACSGTLTFGDGTEIDGTVMLTLEDDGFFYVGLG